MKVHHFKEDSETSTLAGRQNASVVRTLFDLFLDYHIYNKNRTLMGFILFQALGNYTPRVLGQELFRSIFFCCFVSLNLEAIYHYLGDPIVQI